MSEAESRKEIENSNNDSIKISQLKNENLELQTDSTLNLVTAKCSGFDEIREHFKSLESQMKINFNQLQDFTNNSKVDIQTEIETAKETITELRKDVDQKQEEIVNLLSQIHSQNETARKLHHELEAMKVTNQQLENDFVNKDNDWKLLKARLEVFEGIQFDKLWQKFHEILDQVQSKTTRIN